MKTLVLVRHAKSSWDHAGLRDFERPLSERGLHDAPIMASYLKGLNIIPDAIISSPAMRAYSTAEIMAQTLHGSTHALLSIDDIYEAHSQELLGFIKKTSDYQHVLMLVGHNPSITNLANTLTHQFIDNIPTCGVLTIDFDVDGWQQVDARAGIIKGFEYPKNIRQQ